MVKRSREKKEINNNIEKIKNIIINKREIYDKYISDSKEHNLVIEKVNEKLQEDLSPGDTLHFKDILRNRYSASISLLHECSDKIRKLDQEHYNILDIIHDAK